MQKEVLEAKSSGFGLVQRARVRNLLRVKLSRSRGGKRLVMDEIYILAHRSVEMIFSSIKCNKVKVISEDLHPRGNVNKSSLIYF